MSRRERAAALLLSAFAIGFRGDASFAFSVCSPRGSVFRVVGHVDDEGDRLAEDVAETEPIDFDPEDLEALVNWLATLLRAPVPEGVLSVVVADPEDEHASLVWAWDLATFGPLRHDGTAGRYPGLLVPTADRPHAHISDVMADVPYPLMTDRAVVALFGNDRPHPAR
ncbi:hypothetical protein OG612_45565 (plasmid) [Streptomyces sp. NBC_01527]|uniref:hypothetical protein n=1 Tax=Streptomyces sp. NBC_01527 TaxID=2903894 RepID=UPI002F916AD6